MPSKTDRSRRKKLRWPGGVRAESHESSPGQLGFVGLQHGAGRQQPGGDTVEQRGSLEENLPPPPDEARIQLQILEREHRDRSWLLRAVVVLLFFVVAALLAAALFDLAPEDANRALMERVLSAVLAVVSYVVGYYVGHSKR